MIKYTEEAIKVFKWLLNENNNYTTLPILAKYGCCYESVRYGAIQGMAYTYYTIGEIEKAMEWAAKLPSIDCTEQMVLSRVLKDEKSEQRAKQIKWNIFQYSIALKDELNFFCKCKYYDSDIPGEIKRLKEAVAEIEEYAKNEEQRS